MLIKHLLSVLIVLALGFSLLSGNVFGASSLVSLFLYTLTISAVSILLFFRASISKRAFIWAMPAYIKIFAALALYVFAHGILNNNIGLTHYYWLANTITLVATYYWFASNNIVNPSKEKKAGKISLPALTFLRGVTIVVLLESLVVLLQCINVMPVSNRFFLCTGTWNNPNVTAMFLSLGIFAIVKLFNWATSPLQKYLTAAVLATTLLAIAVLQCRSAYLATLIVIIGTNGASIKQYIKANFKLNVAGVAFMLLVAIFCIAIASVFVSKKASAYNRLQIWGTSAELIGQKPLTGHGFGLFEKEYNLFAATKQYESNDFINMPYNDFLELGVEGGLIATALWIAFCIALWRYFIKRNRFSESILPVFLAFLVIQVTNFGFQAIPAMVLFLMYMGGGDNLLRTDANKVQAGHTTNGADIAEVRYMKPVFAVGGLVVSAVLFFKIAILMNLFYGKAIAKKVPYNKDTVLKYQQMQAGLNGYASFHEALGDALLQQRQPQNAKLQYLKALEKTSEADVLAKCGYSYQMLGAYDSSEYYYKLTQFMQPHKFMPHFRLLQMYEQKKDSAHIAFESKYIINMPIKVRGKRVFEIKKYAALKLDSCEGTNRYTRLLKEKGEDLLLNEK